MCDQQIRHCDLLTNVALACAESYHRMHLADASFLTVGLVVKSTCQLVVDLMPDWKELLIVMAISRSVTQRTGDSHAASRPTAR